MQVAGIWKPSVAGSGQQSELLADQVRLLGAADPAVCCHIFTAGLRVFPLTTLPDISDSEEVPDPRVSSFYSPPKAEDPRQHFDSSTPFIYFLQSYILFRKKGICAVLPPDHYILRL